MRKSEVEEQRLSEFILMPEEVDVSFLKTVSDNCIIVPNNQVVTINDVYQLYQFNCIYKLYLWIVLTYYIY